MQQRFYLHLYVLQQRYSIFFRGAIWISFETNRVKMDNNMQIFIWEGSHKNLLNLSYLILQIGILMWELALFLFRFLLFRNLCLLFAIFFIMLFAILAHFLLPICPVHAKYLTFLILKFTLFLFHITLLI